MSRFTRPSQAPRPGLARLWNLLAVLFTGLTVVACLYMSAIFVFPQAPINPFPPDWDSQSTAEARATATSIVLPTNTTVPTLGELPSVETATPANAQPIASETPFNISTETISAPLGGATPTDTPPPPLDGPTATATLGSYPGQATATPSPTATIGQAYP